ARVALTPTLSRKRERERAVLGVGRHCEERSDEAIHFARVALDCFAELVLEPRSADPGARNDEVAIGEPTAVQSRR
ncbi:hypothetical protein, partial [Rhodopseudomonas sp. AAP120]|uniref:hypothetical protein n=1 Tax=Rhodopseudomonas sp. AAP120 TaxID=1523430 RepID=UPI001AEBE09F